MTLQSLLKVGRLKTHAATNEPGHHQTMIESLSLTLGLPNDTRVVPEALRRRRNANDYTGQPITRAAVTECLSQARSLHKTLLAHLRKHRPDLRKATP